MGKKTIKHVKPAEIDYHQWDRRAMPPNPDGRPRKPEIDLAQLEKLSLLNPSLGEVASFFDLSPDTLASRRKADPRIDEILERGRNILRIRLREVMISKALSGDTKLLIFLAKYYLGYK